MTDIDQLKALLDKAGIVYHIDREVRDEWYDAAQLIEIEAKTGDKNLGYKGFTAIFNFDADGTLLSVGIWE